MLDEGFLYPCYFMEKTHFLGVCDAHVWIDAIRGAIRNDKWTQLIRVDKWCIRNYLILIVRDHLGIFIRPWSNFFNLIEYTSWDWVEGSINVCTSFIQIFKFLICFQMDLELQFFVIIPEKIKAKLRESVCCDLWYVILFNSKRSYIWYPKFTCEL